MRKEVSYLLESITFQLSHTADGKPKVLILANDPYAITVELGSLKTPPVYSAASATNISVVDQPVLAESPEAPICGNHHVPMNLMHGKRGAFYSCHERMPDGSWCNYRPS